MSMEIGDEVKCIAGSIAKMSWGIWMAHDHCRPGEPFKVLRVSGDHIQLENPEGEITHFFHPASKFQQVQQEVVPVTPEIVQDDQI